jgi:hypothetical protein
MKQHLVLLHLHVSTSTAILCSKLNEAFASIYGEMMLVVITWRRNRGILFLLCFTIRPTSDVIHISSDFEMACLFTKL